MFLTSKSGSSLLPVTLAPGNPILFLGACTHVMYIQLQIHIHTQAHTYKTL